MQFFYFQFFGVFGAISIAFLWCFVASTDVQNRCRSDLAQIFVTQQHQIYVQDVRIKTSYLNSVGGLTLLYPGASRGSRCI